MGSSVATRMLAALLLANLAFADIHTAQHSTGEPGSLVSEAEQQAIHAPQQRLTTCGETDRSCSDSLASSDYNITTSESKPPSSHAPSQDNSQGTASAPALVATTLEPLPSPRSEESAPALIQHDLPTVKEILSTSQAMLFSRRDQRDVVQAVQQLQALAGLVYGSLPMAEESRKLHTPEAGKQAVSTTASSSTQDSSSVTKQTAPTVPLTTRALAMKDTGVGAASTAVFTLAALQAAGVLPPSVAPQQSTQATMIELHRAAQAGSVEASLALSNRFYMGQGVSKSCKVALHYAFLATHTLLPEVETEKRFTIAPTPVNLRDKEHQADFVSADELDNSTQALQMDEDMAARGGQDAQRRMAYRYLVGKGVARDPERAYTAFTELAKQGDTFSTFNLGYMHLRGMGVPVDYEEAHKYFKAAALEGMGAGWNGIGVMYWQGQLTGEANTTEAFAAFERGAQLKNSGDALYNLGLMYTQGIACDKNVTKAMELFVQAEAAGHWRAALHLAELFHTGIGDVQPDCEKAGHYIRKFIAERGRWAAPLRAAAKAHSAGDHWGALVQYLLLAEQGSDVAATNAAFMLRNNQGYSGPEQLDLAARLLERASAANNTAAAIEYGQLLLEAEALGLSKPDATKQAVQLWSVAADKGNPEGSFLLGWAHQAGLGSLHGLPNVTRAQELYRQSISQSPRWHVAMPARLALLSLNLDALLQPVAGQHALTRLMQWLYTRVLSRRAAAQSPQAQAHPQLEQLQSVQDPSKASSVTVAPMDMLLVLLSACLFIVLLLRRRSLQAGARR
ncbi:hypothetical protein V8C86DRAFT_2781443 [Haematococcus lacustris]